MEEFTNAKEFFEKHEIADFLTLDLKGKVESKSVKEYMKLNGLYFAFNTNPCKRGHTIKDRHSHCVVCDTASISFALRNSQYGFVYIAGSECGEIIKIGTSKFKSFREFSLNRTSYAGYNDWKVLYSFSCNEAGSVEDLIQKELSIYHSDLFEYKHDGKKHIASEVFKCSYDKAYSMVQEIILKHKLKTNLVNKFNDHTGIYNFRNLIRLNDSAK